MKSYKIKADAKRSLFEKTADSLTSKFGSIWFLVLNAVWFIIWILINTKHIPGIEPFDPFPFSLLTMVVSLEAILLSVVVLISQARESKISSLRSEIDTRIDIVAEEEITKLIEMVAKLMRKQGIDTSKDKQLERMLRPVDRHYLEKKFEEEV
jgi:uncharacterized membrane protein